MPPESLFCVALQNLYAVLHGCLKFCIIVILKEYQIILVLRVGQIFRQREIAAADVLIPVRKLPSVAVGVAFNHALMHDIRGGLDPDHGQSRTLFSQFSLEVCDKSVVAHLLGEGRIDQHKVVIIQCLQRKGQNAVVLIIADILLKKGAAAVIRLPGNLEDLFGQYDQGVLIQIDDIVQLLCQRLGNIGLAAGGRRGYENELFVHTNPSPMRKHLVLCEPSLL